MYLIDIEETVFQHNKFVFWPCHSEGSKGGVLIPFHVQILANFTYHVGYKPIFTSHEYYLLVKGAKNRNTVIMDPNSILVDDRSFSPLLLSLECWWGDVKGCYRAVADVGNSCFQVCIPLKCPWCDFFLPASNWSLRGKRRLVFWLFLLLSLPSV